MGKIKIIFQLLKIIKKIIILYFFFTFAKFFSKRKDKNKKTASFL